MTNDDRTTINVSKAAHRAAGDAKRDGESWSEYILRCTDETPGIDTDELTMSIVAELDADDVDDELDRIAERIDALDDDLPTADGGLDYDDVRNACKAALREELDGREPDPF